MTDDDAATDYDDLVTDLALGRVDEQDGMNRILEAVADATPAERQEAIEAIANNTKYNKSTVEEQAAEIRNQAAMGDIDVVAVTKYIPYDPNEYVEYEFQVVADGNPTEFRVPSSDLRSPKEIEARLLEATDRVVSFEEWDETLDYWLSEAEVVEEMEEPITIDHDVAWDVLLSVNTRVPTNDWDEFKARGKDVYVDGERETLKVNSGFIKNTLADKDVTMRKIRALIDPVMPDGEGSKVVTEDYNQFRYWTFSVEKLRNVDGLNIEGMLSELDEEEDGETDDDT